MHVDRFQPVLHHGCARYSAAVCVAAGGARNWAAADDSSALLSEAGLEGRAKQVKDDTHDHRIG